MSEIAAPASVPEDASSASVTTPPASAASPPTPTPQNSPDAGAANPSTPAPPPGSDDWRTALGDDIRAAKPLEDVKNVDSLARQFIDLQGYVGSSIRPPSEHASAEEKQAFVDKMRNRGFVPADGVPVPPEDKSGYAPPEGLDASALNQDVVAQYGDWAMEAGLSPQQYQTLMSKYAALEQQQMKAQAEQKQAGYNELRRDWGYAYEQKVKTAARYAELTKAPQDFVDAVAAGNVKPEIMSWLATVAENAGKEGTVVELESKRTEMTPQEAQMQLDEIMNNPAHPFFSRTPSPEKNNAMQQVMHLRRRASGPEGERPAFLAGGNVVIDE